MTLITSSLIWVYLPAAISLVPRKTSEPWTSTRSKVFSSSTTAIQPSESSPLAQACMDLDVAWGGPGMVGWALGGVAAPVELEGLLVMG